MATYKKFIAAVENSRHANPVLGYAVRLAAGSGAELVVIHVIEAPDPNLLDFTLQTSGFENRTPVSKGYTDHVRSACSDRVGRILQKADFQCSHRMIFGDGEPAREILHAVRAENADLLITGCTRSSVWNSFYTGSTVEMLFRNCPIPLLMVR
jgi:nucleotide-binding universal stress UspA family protein